MNLSFHHYFIWNLQKYKFLLFDYTIIGTFFMILYPNIALVFHKKHLNQVLVHQIIVWISYQSVKIFFSMEKTDLSLEYGFYRGVFSIQCLFLASLHFWTNLMIYFLLFCHNSSPCTLFITIYFSLQCNRLSQKILISLELMFSDFYCLDLFSHFDFQPCLLNLGQAYEHRGIQKSSFRKFRNNLQETIIYSNLQSILQINPLMNPQKAKKRQQYTRDQFSDKEAYNEIKDQIKQIRERNLKQVDEDLLIHKLYEDKKRQTKLTRMQNNKDLKAKVPRQRGQNQLIEEDQQEGEIKKKVEPMEEEVVEEGAPSINDLGQHIRPITLTRNKMAELFKSRKFQEIIKGCFVRYKSENSNSYVLALILGLIEGQKQYYLNGIKVKTLLKLQQSATEIIKLSLDHVSNQHPPGNLQISKWLQANRNKMPKQKQFKDKLEQLTNLIHGKVSSHDIDKNLLQQAERVAQDKAEGTENLSELVFFMRNHIHDLAVTLQQLDSSKDQKEIYEQKKNQKKHCDEILTKLIQKQAQIKAQKAQKQKQDKKSRSKGYSEYIHSDRKQDKIRQVYQKTILALYSHDGAIKIREELQEAHRKFDIDVDV